VVLEDGGLAGLGGLDEVREEGELLLGLRQPRVDVLDPGPGPASARRNLRLGKESFGGRAKKNLWYRKELRKDNRAQITARKKNVQLKNVTLRIKMKMCENQT